MITEAVIAAILADVTAGIPVRKSLPAHDVNPRTWYAMLVDDPELAKRYARARMDGLDAMADDAVDIADRDDLDPQDKRVRVDTRKWFLSKLAPKKYGERMLVGSDPDNPIPPLVVIKSKDESGQSSS